MRREPVRNDVPGALARAYKPSAQSAGKEAMIGGAAQPPAPAYGKKAACVDGKAGRRCEGQRVGVHASQGAGRDGHELVAHLDAAEAVEVEMIDERWVGACWMRAYWVEVSRVKYWLPIVGRVYPLIVSTSCAAAEQLG